MTSFIATIASPRRVIRWGSLTFLIAMPLSLALLVAWSARILPGDPRPYTVIMVQTMLFTIAAAGGAAALIAACHIAVGKAFAAGIRAAQDERDGARLRAVK